MPALIKPNFTSAGYPRRIISLVPSMTELLFDLGLDQEIVGVTRFCIAPPEKVASRVKVGGIHQLNFALIDSLSPDLVIANKEENDREEILQLQEKFPVYVSDINTLDDALEAIVEIGELVNCSLRANEIVREINAEFEKIQPEKNSKVAYLIWKNPYRVVGGNTFINDLLKHSKLNNIFEGLDRYPQISLEALRDAEVILLSTEPYPFKEKHVREFESLFPASQVFLVDGSMFAWYGSRLRHTANHITQLLKKIK